MGERTRSRALVVGSRRNPHHRAGNDVGRSGGDLDGRRRRLPQGLLETAAGRLLVCSEKATVAGTIKPVTQAYGIGFLPLHGYGSTTKAHEVAMISLEDDRPLVIFYIGDFDPWGWICPKGIYRAASRGTRAAPPFGDSPSRPRTARPLDLSRRSRWTRKSRTLAPRGFCGPTATPAGNWTRFRPMCSVTGGRRHPRIHRLGRVGALPESRGGRKNVAPRGGQRVAKGRVVSICRLASKYSRHRDQQPGETEVDR